MIRINALSRPVAAAAIAAMFLAGEAAAQFSPRIGARDLWHEPPGAGTAKCEGQDNDARRQFHCVAEIMKSSGATEKAVKFARDCSAQWKEICYLSNLQSFGPVSLATIALPFRRNTNAHADSEFAIVNGTPSSIRVDDKGAVQQALTTSPAWMKLNRKHPNMDIWEGTAFSGGNALPGGGYQLTFSYPLGTYHAEAGRWNALVAYDFSPGGVFQGRKTLGISGTRK